MQFHYTAQGRLPQAVTVQDASGTTTYLLGYDQVGSLKAAAAMDGPSEGRVVKVMDYDAFGNVLADSNPALFLPLAFAGGLRDRFTGLVRFCHRDYDPTVGRFTAPDPLGDTGGDHDLYDYCVDEPVGRVDPEGLKDAAAPGTGDPLSGIGAWFSDLGKKIGGMFTPDDASAATPQADAATPPSTDSSSSSATTASAQAQGPEVVYDRTLRKIYFHDGEGNTHEYEAHHDTVDEKTKDGTVIRQHTPIEYGRVNVDVAPQSRTKNESLGPGQGDPKTRPMTSIRTLRRTTRTARTFTVGGRD